MNIFTNKFNLQITLFRVLVCTFCECVPIKVRTFLMSLLYITIATFILTNILCNKVFVYKRKGNTASYNIHISPIKLCIVLKMK